MSRAGKAAPLPTTKATPLLSSEAFCIHKLCVKMQIKLIEPKAVSLEISAVLNYTGVTC